MQRLFEKLKPAFFREWDKRLLLHRPRLWATKFHYALVFGLIGVALSSLAVWLNPIELSDVPDLDKHFALVMIPSVIGLGIWIWQVSLFKTEKAFGKAGIVSTLRDQLIYFVVLLMVLAISGLYTYQLSQNIAQSIEEESLAADINHLNIFEGFTTNYKNWGDEPKSIAERFNTYDFDYYGYHTKANLHINEADLNRAIYMRLNRPEHEAELLQGLEKYVSLLSKYSKTQHTVDAAHIYQKFSEWQQGEADGLHFDYEFQEAENEASRNLERIQAAKMGKISIFNEANRQVLLILFLWSFSLLLLGLETNWRSFLLSGAFAFALLIGGIFLARSIDLVLGMWKMESWLASAHLLVMLILALLVLRRKTTQKGILWRQIVLTLFVVGLAFLPISLWQIIHELNNVFWFRAESIPAFHRWNVFPYLLFTGALLPLVLWNLGLRQSFIRLHVHPKTR